MLERHSDKDNRHKNYPGYLTYKLGTVAALASKDGRAEEYPPEYMDVNRLYFI